MVRSLKMRRTFMAGSFFLALAPRFAFAQAKVPRIGYLLTVPLAEKPSPERVAFLEGLRDLGYIEGQSITIQYRAAAGNLAAARSRSRTRRPQCGRDRGDGFSGGASHQASHQDRSHRHGRRCRSGRHWTRGQPGPPGWNVTGLTLSHPERRKAPGTPQGSVAASVSDRRPVKSR